MDSPQIMELSEHIQKYAKYMKLDYTDLTPFYDEIDAILRFKNNKGEIISLSKLGSTRNFVGYNIALYLSLHELFFEI